MKEEIGALIQKSIEVLKSQEKLKTVHIPKIEIEIPQNKAYGDYSSNIAMLLAKEEACSPKFLADIIVDQILKRKDTKNIIKKISSAGPGFINITINDKFLQKELLKIKKLDKNYGKSKIGKKEKVLIEFVSANPTGPLHVGHGRWAVLGDAIAKLLEAAGFKVKREYYVNDVGSQIDLLLDSVKARIQRRPIPEGGYGGIYIDGIAKKLKSKISSPKLKDIVLNLIIKEHKSDLEMLGVKYNSWISESKLHKSGKVNKAIERLKEKNMTFIEKGALWFKSKELGDDKNRVLVREDGEPTYFSADIAYHKDKFRRGFDRLINVWGTDHHGYIARLRAALQALDLPVNRLDIIIGQLVTLYRGQEPVRMSKRTGEMVTLQEVVEEIGKDEARFFFVMLSPDTHLDFDLELAKKKSHENPVYYVQYAHARICSILREAEKRGFKKKDIGKRVTLSLLKEEAERNLVLKLGAFPDVVKEAALAEMPHRLTIYLRELATIFHNFYQKVRVLGPDKELSKARLLLVDATRIVLRNVLELLGISAPKRM